MWFLHVHRKEQEYIYSCITLMLSMTVNMFTLQCIASEETSHSVHGL